MRVGNGIKKVLVGWVGGWLDRAEVEDGDVEVVWLRMREDRCGC